MKYPRQRGSCAHLLTRVSAGSGDVAPLPFWIPERLVSVLQFLVPRVATLLCLLLDLFFEMFNNPGGIYISEVEMMPIEIVI